MASKLPDLSFTLLVRPEDAERARTATLDRINVSVRTTPIAAFSWQEQRRLPGLASGYDLTWFTNYWVPLRWPGRFIATVHDLIHLDPGFPASRARRFAAARTFAKVRRDAAHVIFVSRFSERAFAEKVGVARSASVVHHGIDHAGVDNVAVKGSMRTTYALVVAAAKKHKNLTMLLDAWRRARPDGWRLVMVMPGDDLRSSVDVQSTAGSAADVEILQKVSDAALAELYAEAGFVMVPSRYEGFGLPLLEAMRAGAPVVSSTADALVEVASGAVLPFVSAEDEVGWSEAITRMVAECGPSSERQRVADVHNQMIARQYTWKRAADLTADILRYTIDNKGTTPQ